MSERIQKLASEMRRPSGVLGMELNVLDMSEGAAGCAGCVWVGGWVGGGVCGASLRIIYMLLETATEEVNWPV